MRKLSILWLSLIGFSGSVAAGTADSTFTPMAETLQAWSSGSLGKLISGEAMVAGVAYGIVRQNLFAVIVAVGAALVLSYGPAVLTDFSSLTV